LKGGLGLWSQESLLVFVLLVVFLQRKILDIVTVCDEVLRLDVVVEEIANVMVVEKVANVDDEFEYCCFLHIFFTTPLQYLIVKVHFK
jgi:hypothetical protein